MIVAKIVLETLPGSAHTVAERLERLQGVESPLTHGNHRVTATWRVPEGNPPAGLSEVLHAMNPEIVEVFSTLVSAD